MRELESLRSRVDNVLAAFLGARLEDAANRGAGPRPASIATAERDFVSGTVDLVSRGGKRLRAALCLMGWAGAGGSIDDAILRGSASLELLHACALIHDDVMDRSATRRGGATLHRGFATRHQDAAWHGDADQFGIGAAIAAGDLCLVWADRMLRESGLPIAAVERGRPVYDAMRAETIRGQYLDLVAQARRWPDLDDALTVALAKTAACTTTGPLRFGGALAGAPQRLMAAYEAYGSALGLAFQLRDDQLGAFADPAVTGKPSGDDLRDGKCTVLLAEANQRLDSPGRIHLRHLLSQGTAEAVAELRDLLEEVGARQAVEERIVLLGKRAVEALSIAALDGPTQGVRDSLIGLVATVTHG